VVSFLDAFDIEGFLEAFADGINHDHEADEASKCWRENPPRPPVLAALV
jgi:hypothetical protein